jgi:radical SAM superfamily enzyme YgiQ (UPF0313 family)
MAARRRPLRVKLILPALLEATAPGYRPIKYALFPPLGLAGLAGYLDPDDEVTLVDEHVQTLELDDEPDLLAMSVYITSARRAYEIADHYRALGTHVCLGGLHPTSLPDEAARHADTVFVGPGEEAWPAFLADFRQGRPARRYESAGRTLEGAPPLRRDLIDRRRYLCPNSLVVSRGCPHHCDFCYKDAFYEGGRSFYTQPVDDALAEIEQLPGRHLYFLDDHLLGHPRFARALFAGMKGMNRVFQGASTVNAILGSELIERAAEAGMRSVFVGFETLDPANLTLHSKTQNLSRSYDDAIRRCHDLGVMVNGSFVFGLDADGPDVFDRTVEWAVGRSLETATFHIMTPYPGTALHARLSAEGRITSADWDRYDTRHVVYEPTRMSPQQLEAGYWRAYENFYRWRSIASGALGQDTLHAGLRHLLYAGGWKKLEPLWDLVIRARRVNAMLPMLERTLDAFGSARYGTSRSRRSTSTVPATSTAAEVAISTTAPQPRIPFWSGAVPIHQNGERKRKGSSQPASVWRPDTR